MPCDACQAEVSRETLQFTAEGQALCRQCHGTYLSRRATLSARAHDVYRRCTCGAVLAPMADPSVTPYEDGNRLAINIEFFFQPRRYVCECGTSFGVPHALMTSMLAVVGSFFCLSALLTDDGVVWLLLAGFLGYLAYDLYHRIRYPRVATHD